MLLHAERWDLGQSKAHRLETVSWCGGVMNGGDIEESVLGAAGIAAIGMKGNWTVWERRRDRNKRAWWGPKDGCVASLAG
jgi:hypothetical protein